MLISHRLSLECPRPLAAALVQQPCRPALVRSSKLGWGPRAEACAMAPRPLSSQPLPARLSNQLLLSQPTCRDPSISGPPPSHPGCNAVDSQNLQRGNGSPGTTSPGRRQEWVMQQYRPLRILAVSPSCFGFILARATTLGAPPPTTPGKRTRTSLTRELVLSSRLKPPFACCRP